MPFVDVLNTMLDETLPLTPPEWPEWGDPNRDATAFRTILTYSPYENVRAHSYPAILALAGLTDPIAFRSLLFTTYSDRASRFSSAQSMYIPKGER
jgi:hypothetical protein